ncbi:MAG TPA: single-stranded DNA-binding protein [Bacilli bacterium]|jgi:single-strand DNA-binding protein|nr:single-stranded DNA-binding protein [Bacilli bacterium]
MNNVSLIGRLTADPELRTTGSGISTTRFSIAIDGVPTPSGERHTDFINIVAWRNQADNVCKFCHKGSLVGVTGRIQTGSYNAQDGSKRYTTDVVASRVEFLSSKNDSGNNVNYNIEGDVSSETTDLGNDPYADMGKSADSVNNDVVLSDDELPF